MAAGCQIVSTSMGALYETCSPFASFVTFDRDFNNLNKKFQKKLAQSIDNYWSRENQELLKLQQDTINRTYSWEVRAKEWIDFLNNIKK
jgi:glycosyltransferase involved in cell wall biosynthesis